LGMLRHISDVIHLSEDRTYARSSPEVTTTEDQEVSPSIPEAPRILTFAELQSLIEQGKTDEIPNNKHIPDTINVLISYSILTYFGPQCSRQVAAPSQSNAPQRKKPWEVLLQSQ